MNLDHFELYSPPRARMQNDASRIWNNDISWPRDHSMLNDSRLAVTTALSGEQVFCIEYLETNWNVAPVDQTDMQCIYPTRHGT